MNYLTRRKSRRLQVPQPRPGRDSTDRTAVRSVAVATRESCALVLGEDSGAVESDQDVHDLVLRLRGHLMQLGPAIGAATAASSLPALLDEARELAWAETSGDFMKSRVHLRDFALKVHAVLVEMSRIGLACMHQRECPPATAADRAAAQVLLRFPDIGCSLLCNGVLSFEDSGVLGPDGRVYPPHRPLPDSVSKPAKRGTPGLLHDAVSAESAVDG